MYSVFNKLVGLKTQRFPLLPCL